LFGAAVVNFEKKNFVNFFTRIKISFKKNGDLPAKKQTEQTGKAEGRAGNAKGAQRLMASRNIFFLILVMLHMFNFHYLHFLRLVVDDGLLLTDSRFQFAVALQ
jgi:hypothetical protein